MPQPRKEQVKNLKTKYARGPLSVPFAGGPVQLLTGTDYSAVLGAIRTGADGGAETSSPAVLTGGRGPYVMAFNSSFTIIVSGVNAGLPITVNFLQADFVKLNATDVMTTSRTAAKINSIIAGYGVAVPVAFNVDGRLVLRSANSTGYTFGDTAFISLSDITPGVLQILGFSVSNQASSAGVTAPKRGLVTVSNDGLGGTVQIRNLDSTPAEPTNTAMIQVAPYRYMPEILPGRPAYGRVRKIPPSIGTGLEVSYFRTGPIRPSVVTSGPAAVSPANFADLTLGTVVKITLNFGNGFTVSFNVSLEDVVTVQQVVDAVNAAYQAATQTLAGGTELNRASVPIPIPGPFVFSDPSTRDSFFVSFNGNTPVHINPPAGVYSASSFAAYVNNQIGAASQVSEGEAVALALTPGDPSRTVFRSKSFSGSSSSVQFFPGNPGGTAPGEFLETLNLLGLTAGTYRGTVCAALYGLDEIEFFCPSTLPGASILIEPQPPSNPAVAAALWGLPSPSVFAAVTTGQVRVSIPPAAVILPEMVEFHEEPDDYDSEIQDFDNRGDAATIDPSEGIGNVGLSALLGLTGKIDPSFIPSLIDSLNLNQLNLGANRIRTATDQRAPRATYPHNPALGSVLLWEGVDVTQPAAAGLLRMYLNGGDVFLTRNAKQKVVDTSSDPSGIGTWEPDVIGVDAAMFEFHAGRGSFAVLLGITMTSEWPHSSWHRNVAFNPFGVASGSYKEGYFALSDLDTGRVLVPRLEATVPFNSLTLLISAHSTSGITVRVYVSCSALGSTSDLEVTVNAKFNGAQWEKDVTGQQATRFVLGAGTGFEMSTKNAANDAAWVSWDAFPVKFDPASLVNYFQGQLKVGFGATQGSLARISADRYLPSSQRRTLLFESPVGALATIPIRIYLDTSNTAFTGTISSPSDGFMFTYNARWDQTLDKWVQDVPSARSYGYGMLNQKFWLLSKNLGASPWADGFAAWDRYCMMDLPGNGAEEFSGFCVKDGVFRVDNALNSNPVATQPVITNALYAKTMIKSWGRGRYFIMSGATVIEGFNFSGVGLNAFAFDTFYASGINGNAATFCQFEQSDTNFAIGGAASVAMWKVQFPLGSRHISYGITIAGNSYSQNSYAVVNHMVLCAL